MRPCLQQNKLEQRRLLCTLPYCPTSSIKSNSVAHKSPRWQKTDGKNPLDVEIIWFHLFYPWTDDGDAELSDSVHEEDKPVWWRYPLSMGLTSSFHFDCPLPANWELALWPLGFPSTGGHLSSHLLPLTSFDVSYLGPLCGRHWEEQFVKGRATVVSKVPLCCDTWLYPCEFTGTDTDFGGALTWCLCIMPLFKVCNQLAQQKGNTVAGLFFFFFKSLLRWGTRPFPEREEAAELDIGVTQWGFFLVVSPSRTTVKQYHFWSSWGGSSIGCKGVWRMLSRVAVGASSVHPSYSFCSREGHTPFLLAFCVTEVGTCVLFLLTRMVRWLRTVNFKRK